MIKNGWLTINDIKYHYVNNKIHCESGPAIIYPNGDKDWLINGSFHRLDGPAKQSGAFEFWYLNNKLIGESDRGYTQEKFMLETYPKLKAFI